MRTKFNGILTLLLAFTVHFAFAQKTITGTVSDETGALPGVNILVQGTNTGTETDFDGNYSINVNVGNTIEFSFVGMKTVYKKVGAANVIDILLTTSDDNTLETVVVTALGIKREKKALGYALTTVKTDEIQQKPESDISRVLQGKVAGVSITPTGGLAGSGNTVIIRSKISLTGSNQPLYVVDGVPFNSGTDTNNNFTGFNGSSASSRSLDIDPNNIASISVLKGLSATVLYGNEGRNGVILITTKNGNTGDIDKKFEVTVSQTTSLSQISNLPDYQNKYGQGAGLNYNRGYVGNWGPEFDRDMLVTHNYNDGGRLTRLFPQYAEDVPYVAVPNNVKDFFRDGIGSSTSLNISKGGEKVNINFNFSHATEEGYIPENSVKRTTYGVGGSSKLANNLNVNASFNYVTTTFITPPVMAGNGFSGGSSIFARTLFMPRNFDLMHLPFESPLDGSNVYYRSDQDNPRWLLKNARTTQGVNRFFGKIGVNYNISDHIDVTYRIGLDQFNEKEVSYSNKGGTTRGLTDIGFLNQTNALNVSYDHSLIFTGKEYTFNDDNIGLNVIFGGNAKSFSYHQVGVKNSEQIVFGEIHGSNFSSSKASEYIQDKNTLGIYTQVEIDFYKSLYLTLSGRNDWTSTLENGNNSIFYPSASFSFIPTQVFKELKGDILNFLKLRGGYATSAGFPNPYTTRLSLNLNPTGNGGITGGVPTQSLQNLLPNPDLRPELHSEIEVGVEGRFFKNRVNLDLSLYTRTSKDQILSASLDPSAGYTYQYINAGQVDTEGIELGLDVTPFKSEKFTWNINTNFTAYETIVVKLVEGQESLSIDGYSNLGNFAIEGQPLGVIMGSYALRDKNGNYMIDYTDGTVINSDSDVGLPVKIIGDPNPDWSATLTNGFTFGNFKIAGQLEYTHGGDIYSLTASRLWRRGVTSANIMDREGAVVLPGTLADPATGQAILDTNGNTTPNNIPITVNSLYFINTLDNDAENIYDGSVIRLREVSLSYEFKKDFLNKTPFGSLSLNLSGQNLWFDALNFPDAFNFDPEVISTGAGNGSGLEFQTAPSSKKYGLSIKATF